MPKVWLFRSDSVAVLCAHQEVPLLCQGRSCPDYGVVDCVQVEGESHNAVVSASERLPPAQHQDRISQVLQGATRLTQSSVNAVLLADLSRTYLAHHELESVVIIMPLHG